MAFLAVSFFSHYTTPHISVEAEGAVEPHTRSPGVSGASGLVGEKLAGICNTQVTSLRTQEGRLGSGRLAALSSRGDTCPGVSRLSQFLLLPRPRPLPSWLRALRAGERGKPIDISGIDCSTLRHRLQSPADFSVDRLAEV